MDKGDEGFEEVVGRIRKSSPGGAERSRGGGLFLPQKMASLSHGNVLPSGLGGVLPESLCPLPCGSSLAIDSNGRVVGVGTPPGGTWLTQSRAHLLIIGYAVTALGRVTCAIAERLASMGQAVPSKDGVSWVDLDAALQGVEGILVQEVGPVPTQPGAGSTGHASEVRPEICPEGTTPGPDARDTGAVGQERTEHP